MKESNAEKWHRLGNLTLSEEEWTNVRLFNNLLDVCIHGWVYCSSLNHCSMLIEPSKHSQLLLVLPFIEPFLLLKPCMPSGTRLNQSLNTIPSYQCCRPEWKNSMSTTREQQHPIPTLFPWISDLESHYDPYLLHIIGSTQSNI